ncbi:hypothetical protein HYH02_013751 [Chlamydomonas schloesseri]|uniref:S-acyltransferase n=1 Tax=Chlamydomonas schloesseri TaxID=2026947 RepID=A0A835SNQ0_9CHLO|nr:hypothetical protein HYH02_013751 [Chlamydomonas schloesseri]|eukprot:KAG2430389.1 hypothetical protein HYH02_013751 [Chlamydomonas schloesseri]
MASLNVEDPAPVVHPAKRRLRIYEEWQGNERFFCWGNLVAGPNWKASFGTALLISAPAGIFLAFVAPYMGLHVHIIILVISCILPVLAVIFLMLTACRDPGIIPRQDPDPEYLNGQKPRTKEVYVNNQRVVIRYNDTCHFYQPPRAHHCSVNDNCIERFDHHCPWVGTTIGLRNYRTFLLFVYTSAVLCLYVFGVCVAMLFVKHDQLVGEAADAGQPTDGLWGKAIGQCIPALVLMGYTFLFFWFVGGLSVFHAYLVGTNQTTYENFRYNHDSRPNPYDRGVLLNCAEVWCSPMPASKVPFRAYVDEFKPPTGQPYSRYLNGNGPASASTDGNGTAAGAAAAAAELGSSGGGYEDGYGGGADPYAAAHQYGGAGQPFNPPQFAALNSAGAGGGAAGLGGGYGGDGYGGPGGAGGSGGGGGGYDPAALQAPAGAAHQFSYNQQYQQQQPLPQHQQQAAGGMYHAGGSGSYHYQQQLLQQQQQQQQQQQHMGSMQRGAGGVGPVNGGDEDAHSDAGAGWATGTQPPAQVKGHHTFTHPTSSTASPRGASGYGHMHGQAAAGGAAAAQAVALQHQQHYHQAQQHQQQVHMADPGQIQYYDDDGEYDDGEFDDGPYDDEEQLEQQRVASGQAGGMGVARPDQVHPHVE